MKDIKSKKKKIDPDGPLPKWGTPEGVAKFIAHTPGQKKVKEACWDGYKKVGMKKKGKKMVPDCVPEMKTIKVGEDAVGSNNCHYALVQSRKVVAIGTKEEMLSQCRESGGRVWVSTKSVGDIVEAKYSVDVDGLPRFYMDADSPAEIKKKLRTLLRKASSIDSVERSNDAKIKSDLRQRIKGADTDKRLVDEELGCFPAGSIVYVRSSVNEHTDNVWTNIPEEAPEHDFGEDVYVEFKFIEDVVVGDEILGYSGWNTVDEVHHYPSESRNMVTYQFSGNLADWTGSLKCTDYHPVMFNRQRIWELRKDFNHGEHTYAWCSANPDLSNTKHADLDVSAPLIGDYAVTYNAYPPDIDMPWNYTALTGMTETTEDIPVYNLTVSGDHTYIVNSIVVHNKNLDEKLDNSSTAGDYIKDFRKSDAPQFKGKSMEKKTKMAIAAYLAKRREQTDEAYRKPTSAEIAADKKKDQKSGGDRYKSMKNRVYGNAMGGLKKESSAAFGQSMDRIQAKKTASQLTPAHKKKLAALHALMQKQKKTGNYKMESVEQMDESSAVKALNMLAKKDSRIDPDQIAMLNKIIMDRKYSDALKFANRAFDKNIRDNISGILRKHGIKEEVELGEAKGTGVKKFVRGMRVQKLHGGNKGTVIKGGDNLKKAIEVEWDSGTTTLASGKYLQSIKKNESVEVNELSIDKLRSYRKKAVDDVASGKKTDKRTAGVAKASNKIYRKEFDAQYKKESVDLDESKNISNITNVGWMDVGDDHLTVDERDARKFQADLKKNGYEKHSAKRKSGTTMTNIIFKAKGKPDIYISFDGQDGTSYVSYGKDIFESVELDEISTKTLDSYAKKNVKSALKGTMPSNRSSQRTRGINRALAKMRKNDQKEEVELDEGIMDKVKAGVKKVLGKYRLDKAQRKASSELRSYYDDWIASGGSEERFMELVHGTGKQMSLDIEPEEMFKDWLPKVRRANRKDDRLIKLRMKKEEVELDELDSKTYRSYHDKATTDQLKRMDKKKLTDKDKHTMRKRSLGISTASLKQYGDKRSVKQRIRGESYDLDVDMSYEYLGEEDGHHYVKVHGVRAGDHIIVKTKAANKRAAVANVKKQWPKDKVTYHNEDLDMNEGMVRAVSTARRMAGNMTGAAKKIDKMKPKKKGGDFSDNPRVQKKLQKYNEDVQSWQQFLESSCGGGSKRMKKESEKMSPAQKKHMDTDKDGDIDSTDLANLRNKKKS